MAAGPNQFRLLLDQNFPKPVFDFSGVDKTVEVVKLSDFDATLTQRNTPDWLIYLRANEGGFDAVVTRDQSQLDDPEEMTALALAGMNVVTWRERVEDPMQEWGQLLAFMGLIKDKLSGRRGRIILLPRPRLDNKRNVLSARRRLHELAKEQRMSFPEVRDEARELMREELEARRLNRLLPMLNL